MDDRSRRRLRRIAFLFLTVPITVTATVGAYVLYNLGPFIARHHAEEILGIGLIYLSVVLLIDTSVAE